MTHLAALVAVVAKHLPPSGATLRYLDINGETGALIRDVREDVAPITVNGDATGWQIPPRSVDAVIALDYVLNDAFLRAALLALRPGGRLIVANGRGKMDVRLSQRMEQAGYVRTFAEKIAPRGMFLRGEKPHTTPDTLQRIQQTADQDMAYAGRYYHLLIRQQPNKPVWRLSPDETITWEAVALETASGVVLLAFSSLPKAVGFMQPAVLEGKVHDVNKVGKFKRDVGETWEWPLVLNPALDLLAEGRVTWVTVDPTTAEAPDE